MKILSKLIVSVLVVAAGGPQAKIFSVAGERDVISKEARYQGPWVTTNRKLNGVMNCQIKQTSQDQWQGRFWGTWEHVPFDYTVQFGRDNPTTKDGGRLVSIGEKPLADGMPVTGKATIDGAHYDWIGILSPTEFDIQFSGSRYEGHLELKRVEGTPIATAAQR